MGVEGLIYDVAVMTDSVHQRGTNLEREGGREGEREGGRDSQYGSMHTFSLIKSQ